ncbi:T9SS type A sorting domain-containing protein [bacterium SCSIO 12643]|nr:T9SS type A sorting domain-containing protein [bacterium SCSIO 12643]
MKNNILFAVLMLVLLPTLHSQTTKHNILDSFSSSFWKTLKTPGGSRFALGNSGNLFKQVAGCNDWEKVTIPSTVTQSFRDISFPSAQTGYISGVSGRLMKTVDGGTTWATVNTTTTAALVSTFFINDSTGFISGGGSGGKIIYKTTNYGDTWQDVTPTGLASTPYELLFANADTGYALCTNGEILKSTNGGDNWTTIHPASSGISSIYAGCLVNDSTIYGAGASGTIIKTTDYGQTWQTLNSGTTSFLWGIRFANDSVGVAMGSSGKLLLTIDSGQTWNPQNVPYSSTIRDISWENEHAGVIVGSSGLIYEFDYQKDHHILLEEHFCAPSDSVSYYGWTNNGIANANEKFRFDNPNTNGVSYVMNSPFAVFDGQHYQYNVGFTDPDSSYLETPSFDASDFDTLSLSWHEAYLCNYLGEVYTQIDVYNGSSWIEVYKSNGVEINNSFSAVYTQPNIGILAPRTIDITELAGVSNAKIRFTYYSTNNSTFKFWWAIDDIIVSNQRTDIALQSISALPGMNGSCSLSANEDIQVKLKNVGETDLYPIEFSYQINNNPVVTGAYYDRLLVGQDTLFTIGTEDLSTPDVYNIKVWLRKMNDFNTSNDTLNTVFNSTAPLGLDLGNDTSICSNIPLSIQNNVLNYDSILWKGGTNIASLQIDSADTYWVAVTKQGCTEYDTLNVSLKGNPTLPILSTGANVDLCQGDTLNITSSTDSTLWSDGSIGNSLQILQAQNIWAIGVDNGCYTNDTVFTSINQLTKPTTPTITTNSADFSFCDGDSIILNAPSAIQYEWSNGSIDPQITVKDAAQIFVKIADANCWSDHSDTITVTKKGAPQQPVITANGFMLSTTVSADIYQWKLDGSNITGADQMTHQATANGDYVVYVALNNGCAKESEKYNVIGTSINELNHNLFSIYPNPVSDQLHIETTQTIEKVEILDISGNLVLNQKPNSQKVTIDLQLTSGIYMIRINTHGGINTSTFIVK